MALADGQFYGNDGLIWQTQGDYSWPVGPAPTLADPGDGSWSIRDGSKGPIANNDSGTRQPAIPLGTLFSDSGNSLLGSLGFGGPLLTSSGGGPARMGDQSGDFQTNTAAVPYLIDHSLDVREFVAAPGTVNANGDRVDTQIQGYEASGKRVGELVNVVHVNDGIFGLAIGAAALVAGAAVAGLGAAGGGSAAASSSGPALGNGAFLGEGIASGVPAWDAAASAAGLSLTSPAALAIDAAPSSLFSSASSPSSLLSGASSVSSGAGAAGSAAAPAAGSIFGAGGALAAVGQVASLVGTGAGLLGQLTGSSSSSNPAPLSSGQLLAQQQASAAAQTRTLLLIAGAVALALYLRK